jgi:hypothetical protein
MANTAENVAVGIAGKAYIAPLETTAPTSATSALDAAFVDCGYISPDGLTKSTSKNSTDILAWGGDLVRTVVTDGTVTFQLMFMESNAAVIEAYFGSTLTDGSIDGIATATTKGAFVFDVLDGDKVVRVYVASGEIIEVGDQVFAGGEAIGYDVTIKAHAVDGVSYQTFYSALEA